MKEEVEAGRRAMMYQATASNLLQTPLRSAPSHVSAAEVEAAPLPWPVKDALAAVSGQLAEAAGIFDLAVAEIEVDDAEFGNKMHRPGALEVSRVAWAEKHKML